MKKILFLSLLVPFFSFAEIWVDYEPAEQVTEMTVVKVKANMLDDYLMGIKRTWVDSCEIQKELGHIVGCAVYTANTAGCLLYTSPSPRDAHESRMPSSA